ncbi:MAG: amidase family protein, partial [Gammaproteobacteria bacterium]
MSALHYLSAVDLAQRIRDRSLSVSEVLETFIARIDAINPELNAIITRCDDAARATAADYDSNFRPEGKPLYGLPIAIKDLALTAGIRTTFGSPIFQDFIPDESELFVQRL